MLNIHVLTTSKRKTSYLQAHVPLQGKFYSQSKICTDLALFFDVKLEALIKNV